MQLSEILRTHLTVSMRLTSEHIRKELGDKVGILPLTCLRRRADDVARYSDQRVAALNQVVPLERQQQIGKA